MSVRLLTTAGAIIVSSLVLFTATVHLGADQATPRAAAKPWTAPLTPWGDPDIQGTFTTDDELGVPFERPAQFGTRTDVTDTEFADRQAQAARQAATDAEEFVAARPGGRGGDGTGPPGHWLERGRPSRRTSIIIDPPDGRIPYLNDAARQRAANAVNQRTSGNKPFDGPSALDLYDRCITRGLPHVIFPTIYNNTSAIVQGPGFVAIRYEMIHDARVIPLDGSPHLTPAIRQYFGDSRGRWEGDTLVVDVTNFPTNMINYRGAGGDLRLTERFRRVDAQTVRYEVTVTDPTTFSKPWTAALSLRNDPTIPDVFEYACHEGNYAMRNILSAARAAEKK
ncbi:MAG TPA: hypothetical protein VFV95_10390 [Vicinamibacterales bacterium]|nr:hypothetical protein [Vicinamibacterales bacterium]